MKRSASDTLKSESQSKKRAQVKPIINPSLCDAVKIAKLAAKYRTGHPFPYLRLTNFVDSTFLDSVRTELSSLSYHVKANDLYEFFQSDDLKSVTSSTHPYISSLRDNIYSPKFLDAVSSITGVELNETVDMSGAVYNRGSYLACHDDHNDTRRIAYIIYLVDEKWSSKDGGALDLFSKDSEGKHPQNVTTSLLPIWNSFTMFEVTPDSWHRVSEVLSESNPRLTISGWFHGKVQNRPAPAPQVPIPHSKIVQLKDEKDFEKVSETEQKKETNAESKKVNDSVENYHGVEVNVGEIKLEDWLNPKYLTPETGNLIKKHFCRHSSYMLRDCFQESKYNELISVMRNMKGKTNDDVDKENEISNQIDDTLWHRAPFPQKQWYNRCCFKPSVCDSKDTTDSRIVRRRESIIANWRKLFLSPEWASWLRRVTSLLVDTGSFEARQFDHGHYSLCHDEDLQHNTYLDVVLGVCKQTDVWNENHGGYVCYMADNEELLTVPLESNALYLVMRDGGSMRFVKYVNCRAPSGGRFDLSAEYTLCDDDSQVEDDCDQYNSDSYSTDDEIDSENDESTMGYGAQAAMIAGHHRGN